MGLPAKSVVAAVRPVAASKVVVVVPPAGLRTATWRRSESYENKVGAATLKVDCDCSSPLIRIFVAARVDDGLVVDWVIFLLGRSTYVVVTTVFELTSMAVISAFTPEAKPFRRLRTEETRVAVPS